MPFLTRIQPAIVAGLCLLVNAVSGAATIHVPKDYPTIQAAINAANHGDDIVVAPGTYHESIHFLGKSIMLRSAQGPEVTTIKAVGEPRTVVSFIAGETFTTIIDGFTITGGTGSPAAGSLRGGGMLILNSSPSIFNCIITGNTAGFGAGAYVGANSQPWFANSVFKDNVATKYGGAIYNGPIGGGNPAAIGTTVVGTIFQNNSAPIGGVLRGTGQITFIGSSFLENTASMNVGGISISQGTLMLVDGTFEGNSGRAIALGPSADGTIINSTFANHPDGAVAAWTIEPGSDLTIAGCTFENNEGTQGAAVNISGGIEAVLSDSVFLGNTSSASGGAVRSLCYTGVETVCPHVTVVFSTFEGNRAGASGGAISNSCGVGSLNADCASLEIYDTVFAQNEAVGHGGAIQNRCVKWFDPHTNKPVIACGDLYIGASVLDRNLAGAGGGAIANLNESFAVIEDTLMCSNMPEHVLGEWEDEGGNDIAPVADFNCDGTVGVGDLFALLAAWGACADEVGACTGDLNGDDVVGVADLLILLSNWG